MRFDVSPLSNAEPRVQEGKPATLRFRITDEGGVPLTGLRPSVWMDVRKTADAPDEKACQKTIESYLQPSLGAQALLDLSSYYVLTLNDDASVSVLDPIRGFSTSKLFTLIPLPGRGEDWALSRDGGRLFVSVPTANQVVAVDTATWKIVSRIDAGFRPSRLALQPDGRYLWVDHGTTRGSPRTVTVVDTRKMTRVADIRVGAGPRDIAFAQGDRYALIGNGAAGTVSVVDVRALRKVRDIRAGRNPVALAYSPLSDAVYVAHERGGISVVDAGRQTVVSRMATPPGLTSLRISPDGRWGFAVNREQNAVHIFDARRNRLAYTVGVGRSPDQVSFTDAYAYVRSLGTEHIMMISLAQLSKGEKPTVNDIPGGQLAPGTLAARSPAAPIVASPEPGATLIANPSDKLVYYYMEGMAAPMGSFSNYKRSPRAVLVADRGLRETSPGVYTAAVSMPAGGTLDVSFLLDSPRVTSCFEAKVDPDPAAAARRAGAGTVVPLFEHHKLALGTPLRMRFKVTDPKTGEPRKDVKDLAVATMIAGAQWQDRQKAASLGDGTYEVVVHPPRAGLYYVNWQSASLGVRLERSGPVMVQVVPEENRDLAKR